MKKLILFLGVALLLGQKGISQCPNTDTHWCLAGNYALGLGIFGTANTNDILLETDNIQTGWMDYTNQYTGIGAGWNAGNRPNFQLDVLHLSSTNGSIFRTIGNGSFDCDWEAWTQTGTSGPALVGRLFVPAANPTWFTLEASVSNLTFNTGGANERMIILGSNGATGIGTSFTTPAFLLDVQGSSITGSPEDINVSCPSCTTPNAVGYRIGGQMVMWHDGDPSSFYLGVGAGFGAASVTGRDNTFVGFNSGGTNLGTGGIEDVAVGYLAGYSLSGATANNNTFSGYETGYNMNTGFDNTDYGYQAGFHDIDGAFNTFLGENAGYSTQGCNATQGPCTQEGDYNVMTGDRCGYFNSSGQHNCYSGAATAYNNNGSFNCIEGTVAGYTGTGYDSNAYYGAESGFKNQGNSNVMMGIQAGYNTGGGGGASKYNVFVGPYSAYTNPSGIYNITLGYRADAYTAGPGTINNSVAIGASALVNYDNQFILGNNLQNVGIGMSGITTPNGPQNRLEISYFSNPAGPQPCNSAPASTFTSVVCSGTNPTGASGLEFNDLTDRSVPWPYKTNHGFLSLDDSGNVIYMAADTGGGGGGGTGIGYCNSLTSMTNSGGYDLSGNNLYFAGNQSYGLNQNDVLIGYPCNTTPVPAKLSVLQNSFAPFSASQSTMGLYVENDDLMTNGSNTIGQPVIGIKSWIPNPNSNCSSIAGWFEADGSPSSCAGNYAIIVPPAGGYSGFGTSAPTATLNVLGDGRFDWDGITGGAALEGNAVTGSTPVNTAIAAEVDNGTSRNTGVTSTANGPVGSTTYGMYTEAPGIGGSLNNYGIYTFAGGMASSTNYGIFTSATGASGSTNYGIYADADTYSTDYAAVFIGNVFQGGTLTAPAITIYSDSTIKTKVNSFSNAISIIKNLKPRTYYYDSNNAYKYKLDTFMHYGFIAQQVKRAVPCMVRTVATPPQFDTARNIIVPASTINTLDYNQFAAILTAAFQEQQQISYNDSITQKRTIDSLRNTLDSVRSLFLKYLPCIKSLCNQDGAPAPRNNGADGNIGDSPAPSGANIQNVSLSSSTGAPLLYQNIPNPFSTGTKINYYLPEGTMGASIVFYDSYGNQIKTVALSQTGNGTLNITPDNLSNGIYSYSLIVGGSVIDTKRMMLQK